MAARYPPRPELTFWVHPPSALSGDYRDVATGDDAPKIVSVKKVTTHEGKEVTTRYDDGYERVCYYPRLPPRDPNLYTHKFCNRIHGKEDSEVKPEERCKLTSFTRIAPMNHHCGLCFTVELCQKCHQILVDYMK